MILVNIRFFVIFSMRGIWAKFLIVLCVVCGLGVASSGYAADERPVVRIGLVDTFSPEFYINTYAATIQYLKRQLPQYRFESVEFTNVDSFTRAEAQTLDFLVSSAGTFGIRAQEFGAEHIVQIGNGIEFFFMQFRIDAHKTFHALAVIFQVNSLELKVCGGK